MHTKEYDVTFKENEEVQHVLIGKNPHILTLKSKMQNNAFRMLSLGVGEGNKNLMHDTSLPSWA